MTESIKPAARPVTWGALLPHGGADEFDGWDAREAWSRLRQSATELDALGFDHLWMSDHLMASGGDRSGIYFEAYTAMAALAAHTRRARLGAMVTCAQYRNVAMLAKQAANVDLVSDGRLILALGGGWDQPEFEAYGLSFPSALERVEVMSETLEALRLLWSEQSAHYDGKWIQLTGAVCNPRPAQLPPIWTGTHGRRGLLATARFADVANWNVGLADFRRLSGLAAEACTEVGRDPDDLETSVFRIADLSGSLERIERVLEQQGASADLAAGLAEQHFIGGVDEVIPRVQAFVDAGARHIVVLFLDMMETMNSAERFLRDVVPNIDVVPHTRPGQPEPVMPE